jgi:universal stress protein A
MPCYTKRIEAVKKAGGSDPSSTLVQPLRAGRRAASSVRKKCAVPRLVAVPGHGALLATAAGREDAMDIRTVLCPTDFTPLSQQAVDLAVAVCRRFGARLVLEHNLDARPPAFVSVTWMWTEGHGLTDEQKSHEAEKKLRQLLAQLPSDLPREAKLTRGPVDVALLEVARLVPADLIVMGSHGGNRPEHHSLTEKILDGAPCPVLTLTENCKLEFLEPAETIPALVPADFSAHSRAALRQALSLLDRLPLTLHVVHVERPPLRARDPESDRHQLEALVPESLRSRVRFHVREGEPAEQILEAARDVGAKLILMGCHPKGVLRRFFRGATAPQILHAATCPVWFEPTTRARTIARAAAGF